MTSSIRFFVHESKEATVSAANERLLTWIDECPKVNLALATGKTMIPFYQEALKRLNSEQVKKCRAFQLDEYWGVSKSDRKSFSAFLREHFFGAAKFSQSQIETLNGSAPDPELECERYEDVIRKAGGLDVALIGIGTNGHIAFNEPGSSLETRTRIVSLAEETRRANFPDGKGGIAVDAPTRALTLGLKTLLESRRILMVATGATKAKAIRQALREDPGSHCPASFLQFHDSCVVYLDKEASAELFPMVNDR